VNARERAAQVALQAARDRAVVDRNRGVNLAAIRVRVKGDGVWALAGGVLPVERLGPLAGACAGIFDARTPKRDVAAEVTSELIIPGSGGRYYFGTLFIAFADGTRFDRPLNLRTRAELTTIKQQIVQFNAMADLVESQPSPGSNKPQSRRSYLTAPESDINGIHGVATDEGMHPHGLTGRWAGAEKWAAARRDRRLRQSNGT
jgi:hypothetical protein